MGRVDADAYEIDADGLAEFALRLIAAPGLSGHEGEVAAIVAEKFAEAGLSPEADELGNVTATIDSGPGRCVLLDSHMDTVDIGDPTAWTHNPYGERIGNRVYGRGAMDMKGPLAASVYGLIALKGRLRRGRAVLSASVGEEFVEGPALMPILQRVGPDVVVICEATSLRLAHAQRGRAEVEIDLKGRASHSSRPDLGINAVALMVRLIDRLSQQRFPAHGVLGSGNLVVTDIISIPYPGVSMVPERCLARFDRRTIPGETPSSILAPFKRVAESALADTAASCDIRISEDDFLTYTGAHIRAPNFAPAWCHDPMAPHVRAARAALRDAGLTGDLAHYAFCTNGSASAGTLGIPTVGFGPGKEDLAHRADEYVDIDELVAAARGYAALIDSLAAGDW
jgi:putative selenium metabolism hydrolase